MSLNLSTILSQKLAYQVSLLFAQKINYECKVCFVHCLNTVFQNRSVSSHETLGRQGTSSIRPYNVNHHARRKRSSKAATSWEQTQSRLRLLVFDFPSFLLDSSHTSRSSKSLGTSRHCEDVWCYSVDHTWKLQNTIYHVTIVVQFYEQKKKRFSWWTNCVEKHSSYIRI